MKNEKMLIDDSWALSRIGRFSPSFSNFILQLAPDLPREQRKELEKAERILGPQGVDELGIPEWLKPFTSKILHQVSEKVSSKLGKVADNIFGTGIFSKRRAL